jgi:hypothetical protein
MLTADTTVTWSLLGESNSDYGLTKAACSPLPLSRHELAGLESNQRPRTVQCRSAPADRATGQWSPRSVSNRCLTLTRRPLCLLSYRGEVSSARFERALPTSSKWCLLPLGYEDVEPRTGIEPMTCAIRVRRSAG